MVAGGGDAHELLLRAVHSFERVSHIAEWRRDEPRLIGQRPCLRSAHMGTGGHPRHPHARAQPWGSPRSWRVAVWTCSDRWVTSRRPPRTTRPPIDTCGSRPCRGALARQLADVRRLIPVWPWHVGGDNCTACRRVPSIVSGLRRACEDLGVRRGRGWGRRIPCGRRASWSRRRRGSRACRTHGFAASKAVAGADGVAAADGLVGADGVAVVYVQDRRSWGRRSPRDVWNPAHHRSPWRRMGPWRRRDSYTRLARSRVRARARLCVSHRCLTSGDQIAWRVQFASEEGAHGSAGAFGVAGNHGVAIAAASGVAAAH